MKSIAPAVRAALIAGIVIGLTAGCVADEVTIATITPTPQSVPTTAVFVEAPVYTPSATVTPYSIATPLFATPTNTMTPTPRNCVLDSEFVADVTVPDGSPVQAGLQFIKTWRIRNSGTCPWDSSFTFQQIEGTTISESFGPLPLPDVPPGATVDLSVTLNLGSDAPHGSTQRARFQVIAPEGIGFGAKPTVIIVALQPGQVLPLSTPGTGTPGGANEFASISGVIWVDRCAAASGDTSGCVDAGGFLRANGSLDPGEIGIANLKVVLVVRGCPGSVVVTTLSTDGGGAFKFDSLRPDSYCIRIDPNNPSNLFLLPGVWTFPFPDAGSGQIAVPVEVGTAENKTGVNIGWDSGAD